MSSKDDKRMPYNVIRKSKTNVKSQIEFKRDLISSATSSVTEFDTSGITNMKVGSLQDFPKNLEKDYFESIESETEYLTIHQLR